MSTACSSTPVIGVGSFSPGGRFALPRSYLTHFWSDQGIWFESRVDNVWTFTNPIVFWDTLVIVMDQRFYEWNSNVWTLDHIICECYFHNLLTNAKTAEAYSLFLDDFDGLRPWGLRIRPAGFPGTVVSVYDLPHQPPDYWLPA